LEIKHVLGSSYHPQSQGIVERMHRTMKTIGKALTEDDGARWPDLIPYAQCALRILPLKALGGRSPYEVVTGIRPKLPAAMVATFPVQEASVDEYGEMLIGYLRTTYARVKALMQDAAESAEQTVGGSLARELQVGDLVLRRMNPAQLAHAAGTGPLRFQRSVENTIYRVTHRIGGQSFAYRVCDHGEPLRKLTFEQPVNGSQLVKLDMPELESSGTTVGRRIEIYVPGRADWRRGAVVNIALDGRAKIRWDDTPGSVDTLEIAKERFRWLVGGAAGEGEA
jgi:hypothetical protein